MPYEPCIKLPLVLKKKLIFVLNLLVVHFWGRMAASGLRTSFGSKVSGNPLHQENKFNLQTKKVVGCASSKEYSDPNDLRAEIQKKMR